MNIIIALIEMTAFNLIAGGFLFFNYFLKRYQNSGFTFKKDWPYFSFFLFVCIFLFGLSLNRLSSVIGMDPFIWHKIKISALFALFLILPVTGHRMRRGRISKYYGLIHIVLTITISCLIFSSTLIIKNSALVFENGLIVLDLNLFGLLLYGLSFVLLSYEYISFLFNIGRNYRDHAKKRIMSGIIITFIYFIIAIGIIAGSRLIHFHGYLYDLTSIGFIFMAFYFMFFLFNEKNNEKSIRKENLHTDLQD